MLAALLGCGSWPQSVLDPQGPAASRIVELHWIMHLTAAATVLLVFAVLWRACRRRRTGAIRETTALRWVLLGGAVFPAVVVTLLFIYSGVLLGHLAPERHPGRLTIEVTGKQWWWEVRYLGEGPAETVLSANEIHIPAGEPVQLRLKSSDVIHSFWVPALQGKTDLIPGRVTRSWLQADRPGAWRAQCAEYCGMQHARMALWVVAHEPAEFAAWLERERQPADPGSGPGFDAFMSAGCPVCHTIRGTPARGHVGPDLTHLGSRRSLASGTLPNTPGHLAGWIANPQVIKAGSHMPRIPLEPRALQAVMDYLRTLR